jgi:hypothetical protein
MGWDIHFHLRFAERDPSLRRFARAFELVCAQPGTKALWAFEMVRRPATGPDERIAVNGERADAGEVRRLIGGRLDEPGWLAEATWTWEEQVTLDDGSRAVVGDTIAVAAPRQTYRLGAQTSPDLLPPGGAPDLVVDAFDYRRYFPRDGDRHVSWHDLPADAPACRLARAKIDALMRRLAPIVELGADSLWGMQGGDRFSPDTIYAVFHRDPERYRDDNAQAPLPGVRITHDVVEEAAGRFDCLCVPTSAGPIAYHARLGAGSLGGLYFGLGSRLEAKRDREALERDNE